MTSILLGLSLPIAPGQMDTKQLSDPGIVTYVLDFQITPVSI